MINDKLIILWVFFEVKNAITNFLNPLDIHTHTHTHISLITRASCMR